MGTACSKHSPEDTQQPHAAAHPTPAPTATTTATAAAPAAAAVEVAPAHVATTKFVETNTTHISTTMSVVPRARIAIVYHSLWGHVATLAKAVAKGVEAAGAEVKVFQVAETLPQEVLTKMHAAPRDESIPTITDPTELNAFDGIIFGSGTRFGNISSQLKAFFDASGGVWQSGQWIGKTAGIFFSTGTQGGGQETTALTTVTQFTHHGMIFVPIGYSSPLLGNMDEIHGGSSYGAGTFAGATGARQPSKLELDVAEHQGKHIATITGYIVKGKAAQ